MTILYILFFALTNFLIYSILNKGRAINTGPYVLYIVSVLFLSFIHLKQSPIIGLLSAEDFFGFLLFSLLPILFYLFYNLIVLKRVNRMEEKGVEKKVVDQAIKIASFVFLKLTFIMVFIVQSIAIIIYHC